MTGRRWYQDRQTVSFEVETGGTSHRITWRRGRLVLHDHDLAAEQVLLALGGAPCPCLLFPEALRDQSEPHRRSGWWSGYTGAGVRAVPGSGSGAATAIRRLLASPQLLARSVRPGQVMSPMRLSAREMLEHLQNDPTLSALPKEQRDRVLADWRRRVVQEMIPLELMGVLDAIREVRRPRLLRNASRQRRRDRDAQELLQQAAAPAFEEAMRHSRRDLRPYASLTVEVWKQTANELPLLKGNLTSTGGFAALSLPVSWLNRIWRRGLAIVEGHFVLGVDGSAPASELTGEAVIWERQLGNSSVPVTAPCSLRRLDGQWRLSW